MSDESTPTPSSPPPPRVRRSSFAGQAFADLFGTRPAAGNGNGSGSGSGGGGSSSNNNGSNSGTSPPQQQYPGPITTAAAQAQRRRMSLTTLGLSGGPSQTSPFANARGRTESSGSASVDESAIAEDDVATAREPSGTPIVRRTSFGARALRDIRRGSGSYSGSPTSGSPGQQQNGIASPQPPARKNSSSGAPSSHDIKGRGEGFNWSDNFRTRAERTSSISAQGGLGPGGLPGTSPNSRPAVHSRAKSVAVMEPPINEMPKVVPEVRKPDHFQERILKGDFYMD